MWKIIVFSLLLSMNITSLFLETPIWVKSINIFASVMCFIAIMIEIIEWYNESEK